MAQRRSQAEARSKARRDPLESAGGAVLEEALPGVRILDQDLELDGGVRADAAGIDAAGRIVLALVAGEDSDVTALAVLDALSAGRRHAELIGRHLNAPRLDPELGPRVVLVVPPDATALVERLGALRGRGLEILEVRSVKSRKGERAYLVPTQLGGWGPGGGFHSLADLEPDPGADAFLEALPDESEGGIGALGRLLVERMSRLDEELSVRASPGAVAWSFGDEVLVRAEQRGERLRASVGPKHKPRNVAEAAEIEALLEQALGRLVQLLDREPELVPAGLPPGSSPGVPQGLEERPGGMPPSAVAKETGPLLSAEELEAFRD